VLWLSCDGNRSADGRKAASSLTRLPALGESCSESDDRLRGSFLVNRLLNSVESKHTFLAKGVRQIYPSQYRLPDFLCLGAQKAGTTTLHELLSQHPNVYLPPIKEVHYFDLHFDHDSDWYAAHFRVARRHQTCGEISPYYLFHPEAPRRIRSLLPDVKLIVLLRDPVERSISGYYHSMRREYEYLSIEDAFTEEERRLASSEKRLSSPGGSHFSHQHHSYLSRSRYELQIQRYQEYFDAEQLLLLRSEDLFLNLAGVWKRITEFLGLKPQSCPRIIPHANRSNGEADGVRPEFRRWLREELRDTYDSLKVSQGISWT